MPRFLPVLRGRETAALSRAQQQKAVSVAFASYYSDLAARNLHIRAREWPMERAVVEGYERVIWVFKSVTTIGADSARLPFRLRQGDDEVDDHPLYRVLNKKANGVETGQIFRKRLSAQVLLSKKGAFVEVTKSNGGTVKRLDLLPPDRVDIIPNKDGDIDHYRLQRKDGSIRNIEPQHVRWFRGDPHPTDPYSGVTPLEAAGMSVELDHMARLYNVSFLQNDGRPGGVLAVRDTKGGTADIAPAQMDRLEQKFGKGPVEAGKLSVVAGDLSYVDLAVRPRDMQYGATSKNAKVEILSAFGVPESVLGYSAERTFDNADAELYVYWTRTLLAHNEVLLAGFDEDSEDELVGYFDTSGVEVLERAERDKRTEARTEVTDGLRSIKSYADLAGYGDEIEDNKYTRSLYINGGKTPIPTIEEDIAALGLEQEAPTGDAPPAAAPPGEDPDVDTAALPDGGTDPDVDTAALSNDAPGAPAAPTPPNQPSRPATKALPRLRAIEGGAAPKARVEVRIHRKAAERRSSDVDTAAADELETLLASVLTGLAERWTERTIARVRSHRQRKHTRHWVPEYERDTRVGVKALDAAKAVDEETWEQEADDQTSPLVIAAALAAAGLLLSDLTGDDSKASDAVSTAVGDVMRLIRQSAARQARALVALVNDRDQAGDALDDIVAAVRERAQGLGSWARGLATQAATATINGARDAAAGLVDDDEANDVTREWWSRRDERVRHTHARGTGADGQRRAVDEPFVVGDVLLRYPGDPLGPFRETAGCRCYLRYRSQRTGRFAPTPVGATG